MNRTLRRFPIIVYLCLLPTGFTTLANANPAPTPEHYTKHCVACHARITGGDGRTLYARKDGLVWNQNQLIKRTEYCAQSLDLNWTQQQLNQVVHYLQQNFYRFDSVKQHTPDASQKPATK